MPITPEGIIDVYRRAYNSGDANAARRVRERLIRDNARVSRRALESLAGRYRVDRGRGGTSQGADETHTWERHAVRDIGRGDYRDALAAIDRVIARRQRESDRHTVRGPARDYGHPGRIAQAEALREALVTHISRHRALQSFERDSNDRAFDVDHDYAHGVAFDAYRRGGATDNQRCREVLSGLWDEGMEYRLPALSASTDE